MVKSILAAGAVLSGLFSFPALAQSEELVSPRDFRNAIIQSMQETSEDTLCFVRISDEAFRAGPSADNCDYQAYTNVAYEQYELAPETLNQIVDEQAQRYVSLIEAGVDMENFSERLVVQLRSRAYVRNANLTSESGLVVEPFTGDLVAVLMLDSPQTLAAVSNEQLASQGVTREQAFELAIGNTRDLMGDVRADDYRRIHFTSSSNGLISGQIWLPEMCNAESEDAAYFLYDRNGLMSVQMDDALGVSNLLAIANGFALQGEGVSNSVVRCSGGEWSTLWPAASADSSAFNPYVTG